MGTAEAFLHQKLSSMLSDFSRIPVETRSSLIMNSFPWLVREPSNDVVVNATPAQRITLASQSAQRLFQTCTGHLNAQMCIDHQKDMRCSEGSMEVDDFGWQIRDSISTVPLFSGHCKSF